MASSVPTAETFTPRAQQTQRQPVRKPEKVAWELEEIRSPCLPGGVGSPAEWEARRSIPAKLEARLLRGIPVVLRLRGSLV